MDGYHVYAQVTPDVWRSFKSRAAINGRSLTYVASMLITMYAKNGLPIADQSKKRSKRAG